MPRLVKSNNISSVGVYRGRRGSQETESIMLQAFGDQKDKMPSIASSSSNSVLDLSSRASSFKSVTLPASMYIRQLVPHHSQASLHFNQAPSTFLDNKEDDASILFGSASHETTSSTAMLATPVSDDDEDAITLTGFRRMSKTPIPSLATSWSIPDNSDSDTDDLQAMESETGDTVFPATSSQIITRKIIQRPDGQYHLQTTSGRVQFIRPDGTTTAVARGEEKVAQSSSYAPAAALLEGNSLRARTSSETSVPDKLSMASSSTSLKEVQRGQKIWTSKHQVLRQNGMIEHIPGVRVSGNPAAYGLEVGQRGTTDSPSRTTLPSQEQQDLLY